MHTTKDIFRLAATWSYAPARSMPLKPQPSPDEWHLPVEHYEQHAPGEGAGCLGWNKGDPHLRWACGTSGRGGGFLTHVQIHGLQGAEKAHEKWEHPYLPPERWGTQSLGKKGEWLQSAGPVRGASTRVHWWEPVHLRVPICLCTCVCVWLEHLGISYGTAFRNLLVFLNIL